MCAYKINSFVAEAIHCTYHEEYVILRLVHSKFVALPTAM